MGWLSSREKDPGGKAIRSQYTGGSYGFYPCLRGDLTWMGIPTEKGAYREAAGVVVRKAVTFLKLRSIFNNPSGERTMVSGIVLQKLFFVVVI